MANLYSFMEINSRLTPAAVGFNSIGELSPYCKTFAKDVRIDTKSTITFNYFGGDSFNGSEGTQYSAAISNLANRLNATTIAAGVNIVTTLQAALGAIIDGTSGSYTYEVIDAGNTVSDTGTDWPDYFVVRVEYSTSVFDFHIWVTNAQFKADFPLADITVVPPIDNGLDFINNFTSARFEIQNRRFDQHMNRAQAYLAGTVVTGFESVTLRIYNNVNIAEYFDCIFMFGYNGEAGVTYANLIAAIQAYLLGLGGGFDLEDWLVVIPQLNAVGTYYIVPYWEGIAIPNPNPTLTPSQYNPVIPHVYLDGSETKEMVDTVWTNYFQSAFDQDDFRIKMEYGVSEYKSIGFFVIPSSSNGGGSWDKFSTTFDDYLVISISGLSSVGISVVTENMIRDLHDLLQASESYVLGNPLPPGVNDNDFALEVFNGKHYMTLLDTNNSAKLYVLVRADYDNI